MKFNLKTAKPFFNFQRSIGVDLGTANTLIYDKQKEKIVINEPSVVAVDRDKKKVMAVGREARDMLGKTPDSIVAVRPLREGVIADYDVTEAMIKYFIKKISRGLFAPEVMISVPIEVTGVEQKAVTDAALAAGARSAYLIEEPRAAALGIGIDIGAAEGNMVITIGGGSTNIAVISLGGVVVSKSIRIAGNKFDEDIIKYVKKVYNLLIGERTAELVKIKIGSAIKIDKEEVMEIKGRDLVSGLPKTITITSSEILEAINDSLMYIVDSVKHVLEKTPPELAADIIDKGIVMTGGGAMLKDFPKLLSKYTELPVYLSERPLETVALGAGRALEPDILKILRQLYKQER